MQLKASLNGSQYQQHRLKRTMGTEGLGQMNENGESFFTTGSKPWQMGKTLKPNGKDAGQLSHLQKSLVAQGSQKKGITDATWSDIEARRVIKPNLNRETDNNKKESLCQEYQQKNRVVRKSCKRNKKAQAEKLA